MRGFSHPTAAWLARQAAARDQSETRRWAKKFYAVYEGAKTRKAGHSPVRCPYVLDTDEWRLWYAGWLNIEKV